MLANTVYNIKEKQKAVKKKFIDRKNLLTYIDCRYKINIDNLYKGKKKWQ